jgi:hypothetical protein
MYLYFTRLNNFKKRNSHEIQINKKIKVAKLLEGEQVKTVWRYIPRKIILKVPHQRTEVYLNLRDRVRNRSR